MNFETRILKLKARTWNRDSCGLYDFESGNYYSRTISIRSQGLIVRDGTHIQFLSDETTDTYKPANGSNIEALATVTLEDGTFRMFFNIFFSHFFFLFTLKHIQNFLLP